MKNLRERICETFCSWYKPGKDETLECLGFTVAVALEIGGAVLPPAPSFSKPSDAAAGSLFSTLCPSCPFYAEDCDFASDNRRHVGPGEGRVLMFEHPPCGGFVFLSSALDSGLLSIDDIIRFE